MALQLGRLDRPYTELSRTLIDDFGAFLTGFLSEVIELPVYGGRTVTELTPEVASAERGDAERLRHAPRKTPESGVTLDHRGANLPGHVDARSASWRWGDGSSGASGRGGISRCPMQPGNWKTGNLKS